MTKITIYLVLRRQDYEKYVDSAFKKEENAKAYLKELNEENIYEDCSFWIESCYLN